MRLPNKGFQQAFDRWSVLVELGEMDWNEETGDEYEFVECELLAHTPTTIDEALALLRVLEHVLIDSHRVDGLDKTAITALRRTLPTLSARAA